MHFPTSLPMSSSDSKIKTQLTNSWLSLPTPVRLVFDRFPWITYGEHELPQRSSNSRSNNLLHIFALDGESLSPNPACLKWQLYLLINRIPFVTRASNNHASPTGALPFILPTVKSKRDPLPQAIPSSKIQRWSETQGAKEENANLKLEIYLSLIDQNVRNAWLYHLYLQGDNFESVARALYVDNTSSNPLVRIALARQLQAAAKEQLLRTRPFIDASEIYEQVDAAFVALSTLLGNQDFFSDANTPGLFDASLVAYTHLILHFADAKRASRVRWKDDTLSCLLSRHKSLLAHRDKVLAFCRKAELP